ncbi:MAG: tRNA (adenosine(37)-N6)-threonylcarbamoyltransferase complex dimerization subunit type 1 TsaB [Candidatus Omnitrophota bacterium]
MKILGIDTTTRFMCLGAYNDGRVYEYKLDVGRRLSGLLASTIKRVVDALGWRIKDIDYFACGLGPGSFTGMRVGISAIKGLAFSLNKPVVGISTLDILAANAPGACKYVIPIVDARRNLVYCAIYRNKSGTLTRIKPYMLLTIDELFEKIKVKDGALILGDGITLYKEKILMQIGAGVLLDKDHWYPEGGNIVKLAIEKIRSGRVDNAFGLKPFYIYPKECQIRKV